MKISKKEYSELLQLAYRDSLTGCYTRNWFFENYDDKSEFLFAEVDINGLKQVNDIKGHFAGDLYIKGVSEKLQSFGDTIRFGGDEFIVVLNADTFDESDFADSRYCFGIASKSSNESFEDVFKKVDDLLYKKKKLFKSKSKSGSVTEYEVNQNIRELDIFSEKCAEEQVEDEEVLISEAEYVKLQKYACTDKLTGCYTRNWFANNYSNDDSFKYSILDLNGLKIFNDTYGHNAGDRLICSVADKLKCFGDTVRLGGDEFLVIFNENEFNENLLKDDRYTYAIGNKTSKETLAESFNETDKMLRYKKAILDSSDKLKWLTEKFSEY